LPIAVVADTHQHNALFHKHTQYLDKHGLQKRTEDVLNLCVKSKPDEPLSFMVRLRLQVTRRMDPHKRAAARTPPPMR
jgi:hypothetical protein